MAEKSSQGNQAVQTFLVVIISVLITAVLVLFLKRNNAAGASDSTTASSASPETAAKLANDSESKKALINESIENLRKVYAGIDSREGDLGRAITERDNALAARDSFSDQVVELKSELNALRSSAAQTQQAIAELEKLNKEYAGVQKLNQTLMQENQKLKSDDSASTLAKENTKLKLDIADLQLKIDEVNAQLKLAKEQAEGLEANSAELISLRTTNKELQKQLSELRIKLNRSLLFVKEVTALNPKAAKLFAALKALDGQSGDKLNAAYIALETTLNVKKVRIVKFAEGSAFINDIETGQIVNDMLGAGEDSFFLVVGYASTTGSADANYELSAKRATSVASAVLSNKTEKQNVKAVFMGQTTRFSPTTPAENQVCEIWEIK